MKVARPLVFLLLLVFSARAETFRVAAYNVENYLDAPTESRPRVKSDDAKKKIRESIVAMNPDVLALEEMGSTNALLELRDSLKDDACDFPFWEHVSGFDTNIHVAVLSKFPFVAARPHTNENFLLDGRRFRVSRGFAEVEIQAANDFSFTLIAAHLKSRRPVPSADEAELRLEEAKKLRALIDKKLSENPNARLIVLGDFNDTHNTEPIKTIVGRGKTKLTDTRPAERNGDDAPPGNARYEPRNITWTHHYGVEDTYSRVDYIFISRALTKFWLPGETYIPKIPNWGVGSDHRPVTAAFATEK
jgi:endonuclease/exonuclease/phosphatase family metal-dependent hydrolase